jgi:exodeoxyribonuclease V alpha subunit
MTFDESQLAAIERARHERFCIINGPAGTGKTSIIKAIADAMKKTKENYAMCAFAGKAAARLKEATGHNATTIHRMLEYKGDFGFSLRTLKGTTVIIDEASMVSSDLMAEIVKREPTRLILVGDEAQLAPVGSGQPFHDIIKLFPGKVSTLTTCYRNREAIFKAALAIRHGDMPLPQDKTDDETWGFYATGGAEATHEMLLTGVRNGDIDFAQDVILCCRNGENEMQKASVKSMNIDIKAIVNPSDTPISVGDRIINTKNNADLDIWNGTTGSVKAIDHDGGVWFTLDYPVTDWVRSTAENTVYINEVLVPKDHRKFLDLAYALTVHKSQGSQYRKVFCVCLCRDQMTLLDRSMIYTAVTRARKECAVLGEPRALQDAVRTVRTKNTVIQELAKGTKTT